jgi:substrate-binding family protein
MRAWYSCALLLACSTPTTTPPAEPLTIGSTGPLSGPDQMVGLDMQRGLQLAFDEQNAIGGIQGRKVVLSVMDDGDDPQRAEDATRQLVGARATTDLPRCPSTSAVSSTALVRGAQPAIAIVGASGTSPVIVRGADVAVETQTLFFGAASGMTAMLRDLSAGDCARYIFNYRASYVQEAHAAVGLFRHLGVTGYANMISFDQNDSLGDAGYNALSVAYADVFGAQLPLPTPIARVRYTRNDDTSVPAAAVAAETYVKNLLATQPGTITVGVMMTDTYGASATFIQAIRNWQFAASADQTQYQMATRLQVAFSNLSPAQPNALADYLANFGSVSTPSGPMPFTRDVYVSEVVPNYRTDTSELVVAYNQAIARAGAQPGFTSLEGYLVARAFLAGLDSDPGTFTPDSLVADFEALHADHQYPASVFGTALQPDGTFATSYVWTADGSPAGTFTPTP